MRLVVSLILFCLAASDAHAQLIQILFKDAKVEKNYAKYLTKVGASNCLIGEIKAGLKIDKGRINYISGAEAKNEVWTADPADPSTPSYSLDPKTMEKVRNKKSKLGPVGIAGDDILAIRILDPYRTLPGIAADFDRLNAEIDDLQKERDTKPKTERPWFDLHGRLTGRLDQLVVWLTNLGYGTKAKEVQKELEKQKKVVAKAAANEREKASIASIKIVPTPQKLVDVAAKVAGGKYTFKVAESKHLRFTYVTELNDAEIQACLELAEHVIEGFLRDLVDPYVDDQFPNYVPDSLIQEFYYGPEDLAIHEKMLTDYYGLEWGRNKQDELKAEGADYYRKEAPSYLGYRKVVKEVDLPGYTVHEVGHALMDLHYNKGNRNDAQDWLREAVGYYVSLNYIGRNGLICFSSHEDAYAYVKQEIGVKTPQTGIADVMNQIALKVGPPIDALAVKKLWQINDADFAKSWSFFEYVVRKLGKPGQVWLRETCTVAGDPKAVFPKDWRRVTQVLKPVAEGQDVFAALEKDWKAYAERDQIATVPSSRK